MIYVAGFVTAGLIIGFTIKLWPHTHRCGARGCDRRFDTAAELTHHYRRAHLS